MKVLLSLCSLFLISCASLPPANPSLVADMAQLGKIIDLKTGNVLSPKQLLNKLASQQRIVVGEQHDNRYHHQIELWLAQSLAKQRPQGSVLLEMLNPDQQSKVDKVKAWLQGNPVVRSERIAELLNWQGGWDWDLYGDLAVGLMHAPYPLLSANLDKPEMQAIYRNKPLLAGERSGQATVRAKLETIVREMHDNQIETPQLLSMIAVQQQRDRRMAERLLAAPTPALLMAGGYHAAKDVGVPLHAQDLAPTQPVTVLMLAEQGAEIALAHADYVWLTPLAANKACFCIVPKH
ncbi:ChaN family lipoprotein [Iodobacter sp.]|uniref:ChaN family lipoprotein n=1 Tax=Iodobacter sp. TaxID=1915058 RepID=UPI0025FCC87E|nr:ChaN family lipoprotein [Iodobacter sp.]